MQRPVGTVRARKTGRPRRYPDKYLRFLAAEASRHRIAEAVLAQKHGVSKTLIRKAKRLFGSPNKMSDIPYNKLLRAEDAQDVCKALIVRAVPFTCQPGPRDMVFVEVGGNYSEQLQGLTSHFQYFKPVPQGRKLEKEFQDSTIGTHVVSTGGPIGSRNRGVGVTLHWREGDVLPSCAEVYDLKSGGNNHYAEIGLWWDHNGALTDYDGVDNWISEIGILLQEWEPDLDLSYVKE
jgi:hypothetical protein